MRSRQAFHLIICLCVLSTAAYAKDIVKPAKVIVNGRMHFTPSIECTYTVNESNVARNEYERTKIAFMTRMLF